MKTISISFVLLVAALLALLAASVLAHGGGVDSHGGHHDRKRGGYHFHRGPLVGQDFASQAAGVAALNTSQAKPGSSQQSLAPTPLTRTADQRLDALIRLLVRKGVITEAELITELKAAR